MLPVSVGKQEFEKEGVLPIFTVHVKENGNTVERKYKLNGVIVKRAAEPGEQGVVAAQSGRRTSR